MRMSPDGRGGSPVLGYGELLQVISGMHCALELVELHTGTVNMDQFLHNRAVFLAYHHSTGDSKVAIEP